MKPRAYFNEIDKYAAQWIRNLMAAGHIMEGEVDERSIEDVHPDDLRGFTRCHFFAGIAVWDHALTMAGWPADREVWTGSAPCQPFSSAGQGSGFDDPRHLWPAFHHLISECRPPVILGEQVASKDADPWINLVCADVEGMGYAFGAVPFPSAGIGAPHIRDRLYWVANATGSGRREERSHAGRRLVGGGAEGRPAGRLPGRAADRLDHADHARLAGHGRSEAASAGAEHCVWPAGGSAGTAGDARGLEHAGQHDDAGEVSASSAGQPQADRPADQPGGPGVSPGRMADPDGGHAGAERQQRSGQQRQQPQDGRGRDLGPAAGPVNGLWSAADRLGCRDGKWRPVEPGSFPLVDGPASRLGRGSADWHTPAGPQGFGHRAGRLKGYGNAINAEAARVFIECVMDCMP